MRLTRAYQRGEKLLAALAGALAVGGLILLEGFYIPPLPPGFLAAAQLSGIALFVALRLLGWFLVRDRRAYLREHGLDSALILALSLIWLLDSQQSLPLLVRVASVYIGATQALAAMQWLVVQASRRVAQTQAGANPARTMVFAFALVILVGAGLLYLPKATTEHVTGNFGQHAVNCLFTATSATCVTGLVVYDTGTEFNRFGQIVILLLIQAGGLGIVFFGTLLGVIFGRQMSLHDSALLQDVLSHRMLGQIGRLVRFVVFTTFAIEALGAAFLFGMFHRAGMSIAESWYQAVFHAVAAFCNAGFSLTPNGQSLIVYRGHWQVYVVATGLIILGVRRAQQRVGSADSPRRRPLARPTARGNRPATRSILIAIQARDQHHRDSAAGRHPPAFRQ
jgi:hypothetical protein